MQQQQPANPTTAALVQRFIRWQAARRFVIAGAQPAQGSSFPSRDGAVHIQQQGF